MDSSTASSADIEQLIARLVAAGYRVIFEPKGLNIGVDIVLEKSGAIIQYDVPFPKLDLSRPHIIREFMNGNVALILHPDPFKAGSLVAELQRACWELVREP